MRFIAPSFLGNNVFTFLNVFLHSHLDFNFLNDFSNDLEMTASIKSVYNNRDKYLFNEKV